jgi:hypothetical protein
MILSQANQFHGLIFSYHAIRYTHGGTVPWKIAMNIDF